MATEYHGVVEQVSFQDPGYGTRGSDKFYRAYLIESDDETDVRVLFEWGRRGSKGQRQVHVCAHATDAQAIITRKLNSKRHEGYGEKVPGDGTRELPYIGDELLMLAGVNTMRPKGAPVGPTDAGAVFKVFAYDIDRARRLAFGDAAEQAQAIGVRDGLREQLATLRNEVAKAEGSLEFVEELVHMALEGATT